MLSLFTVKNSQIKSQFIILEYVRFCMSRKFSSDGILICKKALLGQLMLPSVADCVVLMRELSGSMPKREIESGFLGLGRGQFKSFVREACLCVQPLCDQYVPSSFYRQIWKLPIPSKLSLV